MKKFVNSLCLIFFIAFLCFGCTKKTPEPMPINTNPSQAYVAPQFAPVRSPTYPALGGPVIQMDTASIPLVQGQ